MGKKEGEPWDDSALINAFDRAISNYKLMHGKGCQEEKSLEEGRFAESNVSAVVGNNRAKRDLEMDDVKNVASTLIIETGGTINPLSVKGSNFMDGNGTGHHMGSSNGQNVHDVHPNTQCVEDYNHLLNQYYKLEEQRQKVLQQLYQYDNWNYQGPYYGGQWGTSASQEQQVPAAQASCPTDSTIQLGSASASQDHQVTAAQPSRPTVACSCCPSICPCTSSPACTSCDTCVGKSCNATSGEDDLVKIAMGAADRALSLLKTKYSHGSEITEEREKKQEADIGKLAQSNSSETDLTVVFNAWYSAGFYTGKYLMEQSAAKK